MMELQKIAEKYIKSGLACLPTNKDKSPALKEGWKGGITDLSKYENSKGIGVICGKVSGGVCCIDIDNHSGDAKQNISAFVSEIKEIYDKYDFVIEGTMNGGYHFLFKSEKNEGNQKLASKPIMKNNKWVADAIFETRENNGYFVSAPTDGYEILRGDIINIPKVTDEERNILISVAKSFNIFYEQRKEVQEQTEKPGDLFNNDISSIDEAKSELISAGWRELNKTLWQRPDKKKGISATFGKVADNVFYVFTSNGYPFEPNRGYTPFQIVALLKYKGDFKAFAKELHSRYKPDGVEVKKVREEKKIKLNLEDILSKNYIDTDVVLMKPPVIMRILEGQFDKLRLFTLGNFSAITGKSKSKKTFLASMFLASVSMNEVLQNKFESFLPEGKGGVMSFDTEQSRYDAYTTVKRVNRIRGYENDAFAGFCLREYTYMERCEIIEYALEKYKGIIGFVLIDGIADLSKGINDEEEATRVVALLMKWTKIYDCHIQVIIHQNKDNNYATGHLGSAILKKAETIISVKKDEVNKNKSIVECFNIRGARDFEDFVIEIDDVGMPFISNNETEKI